MNFYEIDFPYVDDDHKNLIQKDFSNIWKVINAENLKELLLNKLDPNIKDFRGDTLLHSFVKKKDFDLVKILIKFKADPNLLNNEFLKPVQCICQNIIQNFFCYLCAEGQKEDIIILLKLGIKLNVYNKDYCNYPFNILKKNKHYELMSILNKYYSNTEEFKLLCPVWEVNSLYIGKFLGQKKMFQDRYNKVIYGIWTKNRRWEIMKKNKKKNFSKKKFYYT